MEATPTNEELARTLDDLFYAAHQSAIYAYWCLVRLPVETSLNQIGIQEAGVYFSNGLIETSLLFVRKSAEFFKPKQPHDKPDTLYAYLYLPDWRGVWIVSRDDMYTELHKRVAHLSIQDVRYGKKEWPLIKMTRDTVDQWITFFERLPSSPVFKEADISSMIADRNDALKYVLAGIDRLLKQKNEC